MTALIVLDTCVWLSLAGDYRNLPLLRRMAAMAAEEEIEFVVPDIVAEEFKRNIDRVMSTSKTSQREKFKRVRAMIKQFGEGDTASLLSGILDVENKIHMHADAVDETLAAVRSIMDNATYVVPSVIARSRAATRGLDMVAPFNRNRNGIADAVILETYYEFVEESTNEEDRFAFISSNTRDFTDPTVDQRAPHKDIAFYFDGVNSTFATDIADYFNNLMTDLDPNGVFDDFHVAEDDPRVSSEIGEAIELFRDQIWYNRHCSYMAQIERGEIEVVDEMPKNMPYDQTKVTKSNLAAFRAAGERIEKKYAENPEVLGPWNDFEWGMINGKLSALRWVMGDEWDFLDT